MIAYVCASHNSKENPRAYTARYASAFNCIESSDKTNKRERKKSKTILPWQSVESFFLCFCCWFACLRQDCDVTKLDEVFGCAIAKTLILFVCFEHVLCINSTACLFFIALFVRSLSLPHSHAARFASRYTVRRLFECMFLFSFCPSNSHTDTSASSHMYTNTDACIRNPPTFFRVFFFSL